MKTYPDQSILAHVSSHGHAQILAARGPIAVMLAEHAGPYVCELTGIRVTDLPRTPGLRVWEGSIVVEPGDDSAVSWRGQWRGVVLGDFPRFGMAAPGPRLTEEIA